MTAEAPHRHPALAATLSFLFPGLGQAYAGQRRWAALFAVPVAGLVAIGLLAWWLAQSALRNQILSTPFLIALLAVDAALLIWRLSAILHAGLRTPGASVMGETRRHHRVEQASTTSALILLTVLTVAMHVYAGVVITSLNAALEAVFGGGVTRDTPNGQAPATDEPLNLPEYRWDGTERINVLLLGVDSRPGSTEALTDTILVVSVDPVAHDAVMVSIPRDTGFLPLPDTSIYPDGLYPGKANEMSSEAEAAADRWCPDLSDAQACGIRSLQRSIGLYLGISLHYYALVDLAGFAELIDAVGGIDLCLNGRLVDPQYTAPGSDERGIELPAGCRRYDGAEALAYARIRQGTLISDNGTEERQDDFKRAERQQKVLLALRTELADADLIFELPDLLSAVGGTVTTDFPRSMAGDLASLLPLITGDEIERVVLGLPDFVDPPLEPRANYLLIPRRDAITAEAERLFGADGPLEGWYVGSDASSPPS